MDPGHLTTGLTTFLVVKAGNPRKLLVRKGGLEPPRSCERQPLKLVDLLCGPVLTRIRETDVWQRRAAALARDDRIRTDSHTAVRPRIWLRLELGLVRSGVMGGERARSIGLRWTLSCAEGAPASVASVSA
jgi:hypothetical protein